MKFITRVHLEHEKIDITKLTRTFHVKGLNVFHVSDFLITFYFF